MGKKIWLSIYAWFSLRILVNSKSFKLSLKLNLSLTHLRAQIVCYELKGDLSPAWQFRKFWNYNDLFGKPCKRDWTAKVDFLIQVLQTFGFRCKRYFWDIRLKILRLPNFNMLFQLVPTKLNYFRVCRKLITWSSHAKSLLFGVFERFRIFSCAF